MNKQPYTYTILRYVHDTSTGEFANVGVVVSAPDCPGDPAATRKRTLGSRAGPNPARGQKQNAPGQGPRGVIQAIEMLIDFGCGDRI